MKKGNPAAALAIIVSIFGAAGLICLLPDGRVGEPLMTAEVLPSRTVFAVAAPLAAVAPTSPLVALTVVHEAAPPAAMQVETRPDFDARQPMEALLHVSTDPGAPPALQATHLSFVIAAAAPVTAEPMTNDDRWTDAVPAAFDRTGSALASAFRKTGAGVKTAFAVLTP